MNKSYLKIIFAALFVIQVSALTQTLKDRFQIFSDSIMIAQANNLRNGYTEYHEYTFQNQFQVTPKTTIYINSFRLSFFEDWQYYQFRILINQTSGTGVRFAHRNTGSSFGNNKFMRIGLLYWNPVTFTDIISVGWSAIYQGSFAENVSIASELSSDMSNAHVFCFYWNFAVINGGYESNFYYFGFQCQKKQQSNGTYSINLRAQGNLNQFVYMNFMYLIFRPEKSILVYEIFSSIVQNSMPTSRIVKKYSQFQILIAYPNYHAYQNQWQAIFQGTFITSVINQGDNVSYLCISITPKQYVEIQNQLVTISLDQNIFQIVSDNYAQLQGNQFISYQTNITNPDDFRIVQYLNQQNSLRINVEYKDWFKNKAVQFNIKCKTKPKINGQNYLELRYKLYFVVSGSHLATIKNHQISYLQSAILQYVTIEFNLRDQLIDMGPFVLTEYSKDLKAISFQRYQNPIKIVFQYYLPQSQTISFTLKSLKGQLTLKGQIQFNLDSPDSFNVIRLMIEVGYVLAFLISFKFDAAIGLDLVLFIQIVFYAQKPLSHNYLSERFNQSYYFAFSRYAFGVNRQDTNQKILQFLKLNSYLALSILAPTLISFYLFICSKLMKTNELKEKYHKYSRVVFVQWSLFMILFNVYNIITGIMLRSQTVVAFSQSLFVLTQICILTLPLIFSFLYFRLDNMQFKIGNHFNKNQTSQKILSYFSIVMFLIKVYVVPFLFFNLYAFLVFIILEISNSIVVMKKKENKKNKIRIFSQKGLEIVVVLIYLIFEIKMQGSQFELERNVFSISWIIIGILIVNLAISAICSSEINFRKGIKFSKKKIMSHMIL